jgi:hypothetical protein
MVDTTYTADSNAAASDLTAEAGAPEIEITPAMIEAGVAVLWESGAVENPNEDADRSLVQKIFVAMAALRESSRL